MTDLAAPPTLLVRRRPTMARVTLDPARLLGAGGEARVYDLAELPALVAKLYHQPTVEKARKLALMMEAPPQVDPSAARLAWPCDVLLAEGGRFAGFLMPRAEGPRVFELYNPVTRRKQTPPLDYGVLHRAGANLAAAFEGLHAAGYVVGDVNESNVLVSRDGRVTLVDTDSFQVRDPDDGVVHRSRVGRPEFTPPELQGLSFADLDRAPEHDRFGLAVLVFLLLMEGTHPFAGRLADGGETPPAEERIRRGLFPHPGHPEIRPPRLAPPFALLPPELRALFVRCFVDGHADPAARPTAGEWRQALAAAADALAACGQNPKHRYGPHLEACPWCERRERLRGRDPFPAHVPVPASAAAAPARRRVAMGAGVTAPPAPAKAPAAQSPAPAPPQARFNPGLLWQWTFHPGAWVAPSLTAAVLAGGNALLLLASLSAFVLGLVGALVLMADDPPRPFLPKRGWPASIALVLLVLAVLWFANAVSARPAAQLGIRIPAGEAPAPAPPAPVLPRRVTLGPPGTSARVDRLPVLVDEGRVADEILARYQKALGASAPEARAMLEMRVRESGTVDPMTIRVTEDTNPVLATVAANTAVEMRFVPLTVEGRSTGGWVWIEVRYGP